MGEFSPQVKTSEIKSLAVKGAGATLLTSSLSLGLHILSTAILSRLLTPKDFGVFTMVTSFSLLFLNFGGNGFTELLVQKPHISDRLASNLFWLNFGIACVLSVTLSGASPLIAQFFREPDVVPVARGLAVTIAITGLSVVHLALMRRSMLFVEVSRNDFIARTVSLTVSIFLAWQGLGIWSLVWGGITFSSWQASGAWLMCRWLPRRPSLGSETLSSFKYACAVYGRFVANYFARNMDNYLVGWKFNAYSLGLYKKAYDLFALPASQLSAPLTTVAVSALSRLQHDRSAYISSLMLALRMMSFVGMGVGSVLALTGREVIFVLLGPGWGTAGDIFAFFGPGIGVLLLYSTHGWIHLSLGKPERWLKWGLVEFAVTGLSFLIGLSWGPEGVAAAWTLSYWVLIFPAFRYAGSPIKLSGLTVFVGVWRFALASMVTILTMYVGLSRAPWMVGLISFEVALLRGVINGALTLILYVSLVVFLHRGIEPIRLLKKVAREMLPPRGAPTEPTPANVEPNPAVPN